MPDTKQGAGRALFASIQETIGYYIISLRPISALT